MKLVEEKSPRELSARKKDFRRSKKTVLCFIKPCFSIVSDLRLRKVFGKNQNGFQRNRSTFLQILTNRRIIEKVRAKDFETILLFIDFSKTFDSTQRGKMEQILFACGFLKETITIII